MSSIWSSGAAQASISPFSTTGTAPTPGGSAASRFQSLLQSSGGSSQSAAAALGQSSSVGSSASAAASNASGVSSEDDSSTSSTSSATISANDFLSLLVTEMQNQDPTAQTDPNAYIDQLVQINSLEQLISINQNLSTALGTTSTSTGEQPVATNSTATSPVVTSGVPAKGSHAFGSAPSGSGQTPVWSSTDGSGSGPARLRNGTTSPIQGNLSVPTASPASRTVAGSLAGHASAASHGHAIRDIPTRSLP